MIDRDKTYGAGDTDEIKFSIPGVPGDTAKSLTGAVVQAGLEIMSGERREVEWKLVARLDCPGLDLVNTAYLRFT